MVRRIVRNPLGLHAVGFVWRVPFQSVKLDSGCGLGVLDAKPVTVPTMNDRDGDAAVGDLRGMTGRISLENLRIRRGYTID